MVMPNFIIIGAAKAGTSSLHYYLRQHPQIFMPFLKETNFFALEGEELNFKNPDQAINQNSITTIEDYQKLFESAAHETAIGEASPLYFYSKKAAKAIKHYIPDAKLILILRNPIDRAFSCYTHLLREGYETLSFEDSLLIEDQRINENWAHLWHYTKGGFYYDQLKAYYDLFEEDKIGIFLFEDFCKSSITVLSDIFDFLGVDDTHKLDLTKQNVSGMPKSMILQKFFTRKNFARSALQTIIPNKIRSNAAQNIKKWNLGKKPTLASETRDSLKEVYKEDILKLQGLANRDFSSWLN